MADTNNMALGYTVLGPKLSLELQTMPHLRAALKRVEDHDEGEGAGDGGVIGDAKPKYGNGVLQDNWFEDRCEYKRSPLPANQHFRSVYTSDFRKPRPPAHREFRDFYEYFFNGAGVGQDVMFKNMDDAYENNFSTTYDLSYNHNAKCDPNAKPKRYSSYYRTFVPQQDLMEDYGNATSYGLREHMEQVWECERENAYLKLSEMKDKYRPMRDEDLESVRVAVPKNLSSAIYESNAKNKDVKLRGNPISLVTNGNVIPQKPNPRCLIEMYHRTMGARRLRK